MVLLICGAAVGFILGLRFGMLVMLPALFFAAVGLIAYGVWSGQGFRVIAFGWLEAVVSLQIGYLIGCSAAAYRNGPAWSRAMWDNNRSAQLDELIFWSEPISRGERNQWVLISDPESGEQCVRHDRVTLDEGAGPPYVRSEPTVPVADFLETDQPLKVKTRLLSMLSFGDVEKS
jgi:hypothetical protein